MPAKISTRGHASKSTDALNDSQINIEGLVREVLQFDILVSASRIGKVNNFLDQRPRAIIMRFVRYCTRQMILRNKKKLERGTFINEDLTKSNLSIFEYARSICVEKNCIYTSNGKVMYNDGKKRLELFSIQHAKGLIDDGRD
ncbi:unnamed protein product [Didymodactylos carnosus]|uniref:Uncharacterized protein n=1 Tax=Didymodactylos carnosus TaxID=1234261 RepID=A0A815PET8_9BILA|nr:unnamed protein product [Didymodactylos carnosus]CAF4322156.1 unnamed protein product [Didymodactylos carnosus]